MRFEHEHSRQSDIKVTDRRLARSKKKLEVERDSMALFPELQTTETPEQRLKRFDDPLKQKIGSNRQATAELWRKLRAIIRNHPDRDLILWYWNNKAPYPARAFHLQGVVNGWGTEHPRMYKLENDRIHTIQGAEAIEQLRRML